MLKVMIVDDSRIFRKMLKAAFVETGHEVIGEAGNGAEILELLQSCTPDLITLDITMPVMDGIETLRVIRSLEGVKIPPIVALTANAMVGMKEMYLNEGFDGYISKPINREELQVLLNNIFCKK